MAVKQLTFIDDNPPQCDAAWLNSAEKEVNNTISAAGITLNDADETQLAQATGNFAVRAGWFIDTGTANTYVLTPQGNLKVHSGGTFFRFTFAPNNTNTGAATAVITFSDGATAAKPILDINGNALVAGVLVATYPCDCYYDGTNVYLLQSYIGPIAPYYSTSLACDGSSGYTFTLPTGLSRGIPNVDFYYTGGTPPSNYFYNDKITRVYITLGSPTTVSVDLISPSPSSPGWFIGLALL